MVIYMKFCPVTGILYGILISTGILYFTGCLSLKLMIVRLKVAINLLHHS